MTTYKRSEYRIARRLCTVTHVCDGDTVHVSLPYGIFGSHKETLIIRFAGMDTPEMKGKNGGEHGPESYAEEAKTFVAKRVLNKKVTVELARLKGSKQYITGAHGRVVGVIHRSWLGPSLNVELVRRGLAKVYPKAMCSWMTDSLWRDLVAAEKHAKSKRLKLWSTPGVSSSSRPWIWPFMAGCIVGIVLCATIFYYVWCK